MPLIPRAMLRAHPPPQYLPPLPPTSSISLMVSHRGQASHLTQQVVELAKIMSNPKFIDLPPTTIKIASTAPRSRKSPTQRNRKGNPLRNGDLKGVGFHAAASVHPSTYQAASKTEAMLSSYELDADESEPPGVGSNAAKDPESLSACL